MIDLMCFFLFGYLVNGDELSCREVKEKMRNVCLELECRNVMKSETYQCLLGRGKYEEKFNDSTACFTELFLQAKTNRTKLCNCGYVEKAYQCLTMQNAEACLLPFYKKEGLCDRSVVSEDLVTTEEPTTYASTETIQSSTSPVTNRSTDSENEIPSHNRIKVNEKKYWNHSGANAVVVNILMIYFVFFSKGLFQILYL